MTLKHLRSTTANKRPQASGLSDGQLAMNTASGSPGLFFKDTAGNVVKIGPVHVGPTAPNASPASGGTTGNSIGEQWLDNSGGAYVFKIWDGVAWRSESGEFVNAAGDTMTGSLTMGASANIIFEGSVDDGFETTLTVANPTADRTITLPNVTGTVVTTGDSGTVTSAMIADGTIVDADVNASAAIAGTKISPNFGSQNITTTGTGTAASFIPTSNSAPTNGVYLPASNTVGVATNGTGRLLVDASGQVGINAAPRAAFGLNIAPASGQTNALASLIAGTNTAISRIDFGDPDDGDIGRIVYNHAVDEFEFRTNNGPGVFIDSSGNIAFGNGGSSDGDTFIGHPSANTLTATTGGSERLRITSAGLVGIGTSSPQTPLQVNTLASTTGLSIVSNLGNAGQYNEIGFRGGLSGNVNIAAIRAVAVVGGNTWPESSLGFFTYPPFPGNTPTERLTITSSGRVGIGTTSPGTVLHCSATDAVLTLQGTRGTGASATIGTGGANSQNLLITAGTDLYYRGASQLFQNVAGTTEYGRWDSSGRLLVGTSSSSTNDTLVLQGNSAGSIFGAQLRLRRNATIGSGSGIGDISFEDGSGNQYAVISGAGDGTSGSGDYPGALKFSTTADGASSPTERMRINNSGFLKATSTGNYYGATSAYHEFRTGENLPIIYSTNTNGSGNIYGIQIYFASQSPNNTTSYFLNCEDSTTDRLTIRSNGGIANYSANNANLSDRNVKKDISPAANTWDCIKEWEIVNYRYKDQSDSADLSLGVIAQQVAESCPEVITVFSEAKEATEDQPAQEERLGVKEQQMYWMAIKALQEAQVRIEALEAEVAALKA